MSIRPQSTTERRKCVETESHGDRYHVELKMESGWAGSVGRMAGSEARRVAAEERARAAVLFTLGTEEL